MHSSPAFLFLIFCFHNSGFCSECRDLVVSYNSLTDLVLLPVSFSVPDPVSTKLSFDVMCWFTQIFLIARFNFFQWCHFTPCFLIGCSRTFLFKTISMCFKRYIQLKSFNRWQTQTLYIYKGVRLFHQ